MHTKLFWLIPASGIPAEIKEAYHEWFLSRNFTKKEECI